MEIITQILGFLAWAYITAGIFFAYSARKMYDLSAMDSLKVVFTAPYEWLATKFRKK